MSTIPTMGKEEFKAIRRALGLTQAELAKQIGKNYSTITHYESSSPIPDTVALLMRRLRADAAQPLAACP